LCNFNSRWRPSEIRARVALVVSNAKPRPPWRRLGSYADENSALYSGARGLQPAYSVGRRPTTLCRRCAHVFGGIRSPRRHPACWPLLRIQLVAGEPLGILFGDCLFDPIRSQSAARQVFEIEIFLGSPVREADFIASAVGDDPVFDDLIFMRANRSPWGHEPSRVNVQGHRPNRRRAQYRFVVCNGFESLLLTLAHRRYRERTILHETWARALVILHSTHDPPGDQKTGEASCSVPPRKFCEIFLRYG
jgi:hypothetical protein